MSLVTNEVLESLLTKLKGVFDTKVDKVSGKGLSTNDFTTEEKEKLAGIATGATKVTVDSTLSSSSTNPVQNKVVNSALAGKLAASQKGAAGGVAELDSSGKVPAAQLPSYVDDVLEGYLSGGKFYKESAHTTGKRERSMWICLPVRLTAGPGPLSRRFRPAWRWGIHPVPLTGATEERSLTITARRPTRRRMPRRTYRATGMRQAPPATRISRISPRPCRQTEVTRTR